MRRVNLERFVKGFRTMKPRIQSVFNRFYRRINVRWVRACMIAFLVLLPITYQYELHKVNSLKQHNAIEVIKLLYDFGTTDQLKEQQWKLKRYVSGDVYNEVTVDKEQRRLNTYLKFYGNPSTVHILKATDTYVIYKLECDTISYDRRFIFCYDTNYTGKIVKIREAELIDFMEGED